MAIMRIFSEMGTIAELPDILRTMEFNGNEEIKNIGINAIRAKTDIRFLGDTEKVFVTLMIMKSG
jgi:hypothetical protein